ncbi:hypothetical protein COO58_17605 [Micromonospora sp. WMMA1996]|uniref:hypothetical protein n=1 Tax=Micromonospora sp. WMMA1996 TaxID=2039878 RepID=UPI000C0141DA|nr:hypothetical protein [Micromonospora sp. WMMA1996]PGH46024.1 hypothetical protein COO58_17605 [Micromonospora sp. WMMA1996]
MTEPWPPPANYYTEHRRAPIRLDGQLRMRNIRSVLLWGDVVFVDDTGRYVYCSRCDQLVDVDELGRPGNPHRPGLPFRAGAIDTVAPQQHLPLDQLGPLFDRISDALAYGYSVQQTVAVARCTEDQARTVKAIRDWRAKPPPTTKPGRPWGTGW